MTIGWLAAFAHIVAGVLFVGQALFWVIMASALAREEGPAETTRLLGRINRGRWPPAGTPGPVRFPFPALGWLFLLALAVTGVLMLPGPPRELLGSRYGSVLAVKLSLFGLLLAGHAIATFRPRRWLAFVNGGVAILIVCVSGLLRH